MDEVLIGDWNDLAEYLERGMVVTRVEKGKGAETWMEAVIPSAVRALMLAKMKKGKRQPTLVEVMANLTGRAKEQPGITRRARLSGGLGIDVIYGLDGMCRLQVWRRGAAPKADEWRQVLAAWKGAPAGIAYRQYPYQGKVYLAGEWQKSGDDENEQRLYDLASAG